MRNVLKIGWKGKRSVLFVERRLNIWMNWALKRRFKPKREILRLIRIVILIGIKWDLMICFSLGFKGICIKILLQEVSLMICIIIIFGAGRVIIIGVLLEVEDLAMMGVVEGVLVVGDLLSIIYF